MASFGVDLLPSSFHHPFQLISTAPSAAISLTGQTLLVTILLGSMLYLFGRRRHPQAITDDEGTTTSQQQQCANGSSQKRQEAIELEDSPGVYKSGLLKDQKELVLERFFPDVHTLWDCFQRGLKLSAKGPCLGQRSSANGGAYQFLTYEEVEERSRWLGTMLLSTFCLHPSNGTFVAIYARNCPEWLIMTLACIRHSIVVVPLYDTLGPDAGTYILEQTGTSLVLVDEFSRLENVFRIKENSPELRHIVLVNEPKEASTLANIEQRAAAHGLTVNIWAKLLAQGKEQEEAQRGEEEQQQQDHQPSAEDTYIVCYTSGTTGTPKGVILSHRNAVANLSAVCMLWHQFLPELFASQDHSLISYLPLSHVFEQGAHWVSICLGYRIGYLSGQITNLSSDMQALQPTLFPVVPRLLNRFNDSIKSEVARAGPLKRWLFQFAQSQKRALLQRGIVTNKTIWDRMVFAKVHQQLGGKVQLIFTGSAPIAAKVLEELRIVFGVHILEGYGQTECTAMATCTWPGEIGGGHCGGPATCSLLKLADVPELNYFAANRTGEVMIKGPSVTSGYYRDPEKTAELFDADGFLHTGDIGQLLPNGALRIIDRKKHIFKLSQGEYVAPEKIENVYVQCRFVQQIYVDGESLERYLVAIVVPQEKPLREFHAELVGSNNSEEATMPLAEICADQRVVGAVLAEMHKLGKAQRLNSIEQVKGIHLEPELFSVDNGLLTPTLKTKRPQLRAKYRDVMAQLYRTMTNGTDK